MPTITKHMLIGDIAQQYPETLDVFMKYGLHCIGCHVAAWETLEQGAMTHGIDDIDAFVADLNKAVESKSKNDKKD
jgi:hybrid cluster-associated redox disulfide protein